MTANIAIKNISFINTGVLKNRGRNIAVKGNKSVFSKFSMS
jgi:hypothetical protein